MHLLRHSGASAIKIYQVQIDGIIFGFWNLISCLWMHGTVFAIVS